MRARSGRSSRSSSGRSRRSSVTRPSRRQSSRKRASRRSRTCNLVAGGRYDHFNQFGDVWTYRFAGSYRFARTDTTLHASIATGFSPPSSQDKIFGNNFALEPERNRGLGHRRSSSDSGKAGCEFGATYFHNQLSNVIGFNGLFETLNLGAARTQGLEFELKAAADAGSRADGDLHVSRRGEDFRGRHQPAARRALAAAAAERRLRVRDLSLVRQTADDGRRRSS